MSHFRNFPASNFMTDFEIVQIENEHRRLIRGRRRQEEARRIEEIELQERERLWIEARAREADDETNAIQENIRDLENAIWFHHHANDIINRILPYQNMEGAPIPISPLSSSSSHSSNTTDKDNDDDDQYNPMNHTDEQVEEDNENQINHTIHDVVLYVIVPLFNRMSTWCPFGSVMAEQRYFWSSVLVINTARIHKYSTDTKVVGWRIL